MKNRVVLFTLIFAALLCNGNANAFTLSITPEYNFNDTTVMADAVNSRAIRDFEKKFPAVTGEQWIKTTNGYLVKFRVNDVLSYCSYDERGRFVVMTTYLNEDNMPREIKQQIEKQFAGYTIGPVTETAYEKNVYYQVTIKNYHFIKTLRIIDSTIEIVDSWNIQDVME